MEDEACCSMIRQILDRLGGEEFTALMQDSLTEPKTVETFTTVPEIILKGNHYLEELTGQYPIESVFDLFTVIKKAERVSKYDETTRKYVDIEFNNNPIARIRLLKQETEVFGKKKEPTIFDKYFFTRIKEIVDSEGSNIVGTINMAKSGKTFIDMLEKNDDLSPERKKTCQDMLIDYQVKPTELTAKLEAFKAPEIKSYSSSKYGKGSYKAESESDRLDSRFTKAKEMMSNYLNDDDELWAYSVLVGSNQLLYCLL